MGNNQINEIKDNHDRKIKAIKERSYPASRVIMLKNINTTKKFVNVGNWQGGDSLQDRDVTYTSYNYFLVKEDLENIGKGETIHLLGLTRDVLGKQFTTTYAGYGINSLDFKINGVVCSQETDEVLSDLADAEDSVVWGYLEKKATDLTNKSFETVCLNRYKTHCKNYLNKANVESQFKAVDNGKALTVECLPLDYLYEGICRNYQDDECTYPRSEVFLGVCPRIVWRNAKNKISKFIRLTGENGECEIVTSDINGKVQIGDNKFQIFSSGQGLESIATNEQVVIKALQENYDVINSKSQNKCLNDLKIQADVDNLFDICK